MSSFIWTLKPNCWSVAGALNKIHHRSIPFTNTLHTLAIAKATPYMLGHRL